MKPENKKQMLDLCLYYQGEKESPFLEHYPEEDFWKMEKQFFSNPNIFQRSNLEELFKEYVLVQLRKMADWLMVDTPEMIRLYYRTQKL